MVVWNPPVPESEYPQVGVAVGKPGEAQLDDVVSRERPVFLEEYRDRQLRQRVADLLPIVRRILRRCADEDFANDIRLALRGSGIERRRLLGCDCEERRA